MTREEYVQKMTNYYDSEGRLIKYPAKRPMRIIALEKIANRFEKGRIYKEKEVNEIIISELDFDDYTLIRRELYQYKMIDRVRDGSKYWLEENYTEVYAENEKKF